MYDRRVKRTRKSIFDALVVLMLEKDIGHITVRELCEKADVNKSTFYLHFMDIYDCRDTWAQELLSEIFSRVSAITYDEIINTPRQYLDALFDFIEKDMDFYIDILNSPLAPASITTFKERLIETLMRSNSISISGTPEKALALSFYVGGVVDASVSAMRNNIYNREMLVELLTKSLFRAYSKSE